MRVRRTQYLAILVLFLSFTPSLRAEVSIAPVSEDKAGNVFIDIDAVPAPSPRARTAENVRPHQQYLQYQSAMDAVRQRISAAFAAERELYAQATAQQLETWRFDEAAFLVAANKILDIEQRQNEQLAQEDARILAEMNAEQRQDIAAYQDSHHYRCESRKEVPGVPPERLENTFNCRMQAILKAATFDADTYKKIAMQRSAIRDQQDRENLKVSARRYAGQSFFERNPCWGWPIFHQEGKNCWP